MDGLRFSLIVIGVVIIAGVYIVGRMIERSRVVRVPMQRSEPRVESTASLVRDPEHDFKIQIEPDAELRFQPAGSPPRAASPRIGFMEREEKPARRESLPRAQPASRQSAEPPAGAATKKSVSPGVPRIDSVKKSPSQPASGDSQLIVSLTLMARDKQKFSGTELHDALEAAGLKHGEFDIYHFRDADAEDDARAVFSVANIVKPGTFNTATMHGLTTSGLALFMQTPGPMTASEAFDAMLEKAQFLAQRLNGVVGDEQRVALNPQRIRALRERTLNYDFSHMQSDMNDMQSIHRPQ